jgi:WD40 repeat protein
MVASKAYNILCGLANQVERAGFSRTGDHMAIVAGTDSRLYVTDFSSSRTDTVLEVPSVNNIAFRTFYRQVKSSHSAPEKLGTEILYTTQKDNEIHRLDLELHPKRRCNRLTMPEGSEEITCIQESHDGRYLAAASANGYISVWNFDLNDGSTAICIFSAQISKANILGLAFDATNTKIYAVTSKGELFMQPLLQTYTEPLSLHNSNGWVAFCVDCHPTQGVAFAGEGNRIWLLDMKPPCVQRPIAIQEIPFIMFTYQTMAGTQIAPIGCRHRAVMSCIDTSLGDVIHGVRFVNEKEIAAYGTNSVEVFDITNGNKVDEVGPGNSKPVAIAPNHGNITIGWVA